MPRFMVERTFPKGLRIPTDATGAQACMSVVSKNAEKQVTWVNSYVSADKTKTYCIYDAPDEAAIRAAAEETDLPVDAITPVSVLDPYFYYYQEKEPTPA